MPDTFSPRRIVELERKFQGLEDDLQFWQDRSEAGMPFEKHHSQVRRAQDRLHALREQIRERLKACKQAGSVVAQARGVEQMILAVYRIWEFFRAKLAQRQEAAFAPFLAAVDAFAWSCYEPARTLAYPNPGSSERREPPLVFFNGGWSPFAASRDRAYRAEEVRNEPLSGPTLLTILRELPIPVVGLPWYQWQHPPDALVLGHEVGHLVEDDFGLTSVLKAAALKVTPENWPAWDAWAGEVFADVYGCLASGPAFVATLMDILAGDPDNVTTEARLAPVWKNYPSDALRVFINLHVLERMGFTDEHRELSDRWRETYPSHAMTEFEDDAVTCVDALLAGPYPRLQGKSLPEVLNFTPQMHKDAVQAAREAREGSDISTREIRPLFAALRLLFEAAPDEFATGRPKLLDHITGSLKPGTLAGEDTLSEDEQSRQSTGDRTRGESLRDHLLQMFSSDASN